MGMVGGALDGAGAVAHETGLPNGLGVDGDVVGAAVVDGRDKAKAAVGQNGEVIAAVILQHYSAGKPGDRAAYANVGDLIRSHGVAPGHQ